MRKTVVLIECERCHREEAVPTDVKPESRKVVIQLGDSPPVITYEDLCTPCRNTITNCLEMMKPTEKKSPIRTKKRGEKQVTVLNGEHKPVATVPTPHGHPGPLRAPRG